MGVAGIENKELGTENGRHRRAVSAYGFHSLRHTFNTMLAEAGVAQDLRMALSGHAGERVNERYTHRGLQTLRAAVCKIPGI